MMEEHTKKIWTENGGERSWGCVFLDTDEKQDCLRPKWVLEHSLSRLVLNSHRCGVPIIRKVS